MLKTLLSLALFLQSSSSPVIFMIHCTLSVSRHSSVVVSFHPAVPCSVCPGLLEFTGHQISVYDIVHWSYVWDSVLLAAKWMRLIIKNINTYYVCTCRSNWNLQYMLFDSAPICRNWAQVHIYIFVKRQKNNYVLSTVSTACVIRNHQLLLKANDVWSLCHYKIDPLDAFKGKINKKLHKNCFNVHI